MQWLPKGTHSWHKFIKPSELKKIFIKSGLNVKDTKGFVFNPLSWGWELSKNDFTVNYTVCATK
jgi:2-polyprenyl-6-hydroxyphenyl methylase/3-demethylubiquinone-9 3-methyltransferase